MDENRIKGKVKDIGGRLERQAGEWTGDKDAQAEGASKQVEGKVQNTIGKAKDKIRDVADDAERRRREHELKKDKDRAA